MRIFAIGDLHLDSIGDKPMDIFGARWEGHFDKIGLDWRARVADEDIVMIPGDISWAMRLSDAAADLAKIGALPGRKVLLRGNHDYWWPGIARLRDALPAGMYAIQNDAVRIGGATICGTRGWMVPDEQTSPEDKKIFAREQLRLRMSLERAQKLGGSIYVMTHYPPVLEDGQPTAFSDIISSFGVRFAVYGHLHGAVGKTAFSGTLDGTSYRCVACDGLGFSLFELPDA